MKAQRPKVAEEKPRELETGTTVGSSELAIVDREASWCVAGEERIRPQLSHRALKTGGTDAGFQQRQQAAALRRGAFARSLSYLRTEHIIDWRQRRQDNQPVHQIGAGPTCGGTAGSRTCAEYSTCCTCTWASSTRSSSAMR